MSRILKIGFSAAIDCIQSKPDSEIEAIIIGTGKGSLSDTEQFLNAVKEFDEGTLNPIHFIHSTYNQLNGMIALSKKISSYNMTYVHRGFSFEHALLDAALLFDEEQINTALVGTFDEMTQEHFTVKQHWGYWKEELIESQSLLTSKTKGTIAGEGTAFFLLSRHKPKEPVVSIRHISTLFHPDKQVIENEVNHILAKNSLSIEDIDLILSGENGDINYRTAYDHFEQLFPSTQFVFFKHLCGEYDTAASFATWIATMILEKQSVPAYLFHAEKYVRVPGRIRRILIYNNYFDLNQSMLLMSLEA